MHCLAVRTDKIDFINPMAARPCNMSGSIGKKMAEENVEPTHNINAPAPGLGVAHHKLAESCGIAVRLEREEADARRRARPRDSHERGIDPVH